MSFEDLAARVVLVAVASLSAFAGPSRNEPGDDRASAPTSRQPVALRVETLGGPAKERTMPALHVTDDGEGFAWWLQTGGFVDARCTFAEGRCDTGELRACVEPLSARRSPVTLVFHPSDGSTAREVERHLESLEGLGASVLVSTRRPEGVHEPADTPAGAPICVPVSVGWLGESALPLDEREAHAGSCHARCDARGDAEECFRACLAAEPARPAIDF